MPQLLSNEKSNALIQYKGGRYSGCFWEWNAGYYDALGRFHIINATGHSGCRTAAEMAEHMADKYNAKQVYIYDTLSPDELAEFVSSSNAGFALGVGRWFEENTGAANRWPTGCIELLFPCLICGESSIGSETEPEGFRGNGGIGLEATELICAQCYSNNSCGYCGEFYSPAVSDLSELTTLPPESFFPVACVEGYCEYCHDDNKCDCVAGEVWAHAYNAWLNADKKWHRGESMTRDRVTNADLDALVLRINKATDSPETPYTRHASKTPEVVHCSDTWTPNIGNYHVDGAYGGVKLVRMDSDGGGIENISTGGYGTKRELYQWLRAFLMGIGEK